jgi:hypothetical protein
MVRLGQHQSAHRISTTNELDKYLEEETMSVGVDLDILQYWKMHSGTYPTLARMARDILGLHQQWPQNRHFLLQKEL